MRYFSFFIVVIILSSCEPSKADKEIHIREEFVSSILGPTIDSILIRPKNKMLGIYWTSKIWNGYYRNIFIKTKADSFRIINSIDSVNFKKLLLVIQDSLPVYFENKESLHGLVFLNEPPDSASRKNYLIMEAAASPVVLGTETGLVYIETSELSYHNGEGLICELKSSNGKWVVNRVISAWSMRRDSVSLGVFHRRN